MRSLLSEDVQAFADILQRMEEARSEAAELGRHIVKVIDYEGSSPAVYGVQQAVQYVLDFVDYESGSDCFNHDPKIVHPMASTVVAMAEAVPAAPVEAVA